MAVALAPHGQLLASETKNRKILLWETTTGQSVHILQGGFTSARTLTFSGDGARLVSGHEDGTALAWDLAAATDDPHANNPDQCWDILRGDAPRAYPALWSMVRAAGATVRLLNRRLRPTPTLKDGDFERWIADLDHSKYAERIRAIQRLQEFGPEALPALRRSARQPRSLETRRRLEGILAVLERKVPPPEVLRDLRAIQALEMIATPEARALLHRLANGGHHSAKTQAARAAVERLKTKS